MKEAKQNNKKSLLTMQGRETMAGWIFLLPALALMCLFVF